MSAHDVLGRRFERVRRSSACRPLVDESPAGALDSVPLSPGEGVKDLVSFR